MSPRGGDLHRDSETDIWLDAAKLLPIGISRECWAGDRAEAEGRRGLLAEDAAGGALEGRARTERTLDADQVDLGA